MTRFDTAICDHAPKIEDAPEWVHLLPAGQIIARDGRSFVLSDPDAVIAAFEAGGIDLPIDYQHQNDRKEALLSGPVPAAGWIKELANRAGALWGRVEWTAKARDMIRDREYRFLSPSILFNRQTGEIARLKGAGLVHNPALYLTALASEEDPMPTEPALIARITALLGLPEDAGADALIAALEERLDQSAKPDPRKYAPVEVLEDLMRDRRNNAATLSEERATQKVSKALADGYLTPGMKGWAMDLCRTDEEAFDTFLSMSPPAYAHLHKPLLPNHPPETFARLEEDADAAAICSQLGIPTDKLG